MMNPNTNEEPHAPKRQKREITKTTTHPVVAVLEQAVETCPTAEMYLASIQFLQSQNDDTDDEYPLVIHKLLIQAKDGDISSPSLVTSRSGYTCPGRKIGGCSVYSSTGLHEHGLAPRTTNCQTCNYGCNGLDCVILLLERMKRRHPVVSCAWHWSGHFPMAARSK